MFENLSDAGVAADDDGDDADGADGACGCVDSHVISHKIRCLMFACKIKKKKKRNRKG